jgi:FkbM family methyltransferase
MSKIIYGAGVFALGNLSKWMADGIRPVCFADADETKQGKSFPAAYLDNFDELGDFGITEEFEILSLATAVERYPDYVIYLGVLPASYEDVTQFLIQRGIAPDRIKLPPAYVSEPAYKVLFEISERLNNSPVDEIIITGENVTIGVNIFGKRVKLVNSADCVTATSYITMNELYERDELKLFLGFLRDGDVFFDIGANVGIYSAIACLFRSEGGMSVYAFEPVPETFSMLCATIEKNGFSEMVYCNNIGLSNQTGNMMFYKNKVYPGASSLGNSQLYNKDEVEEITVKIDTLDAFVARTGITRLDYIKCDVEGAEKLVIEGGLRTIRKFRPVIQLEQVRKWSERFKYHPDELVQLLRAEGYKCYVIKNNDLEEFFEFTNTTLYSNFFFIPQETAERKRSERQMP